MDPLIALFSGRPRYFNLCKLKSPDPAEPWESAQAFLSGVGEGEIMTWVGHRDSKMVAHYRHLGNADARRKMNQIDFLGERSASDGPNAQAS